MNNFSFKNISKNIKGVQYFYRKEKHERFFRVTYRNKKAEIHKWKYFYLSKYGARNAFELAVNCRKEFEEKYGVPGSYTIDKSKLKTKNSYEIKDDYFVLALKHKETGDSLEFKLSLEYFDEIQSHYWYFDSESDSPGQAVTTYYNDKITYLSEILFPDKKSEEKINHINRDACDFRRENITLEKGIKYSKASTYEETNSAIPGVSYYERRGSKGVWKASYQRGDYNKTKYFSVMKYGFEEAKEKAEKKRKEWEKKLDN